MCDARIQIVSHPLGSEKLYKFIASAPDVGGCKIIEYWALFLQRQSRMVVVP
jgi:hypothetical protein